MADPRGFALIEQWRADQGEAWVASALSDSLRCPDDNAPLYGF